MTLNELIALLRNYFQTHPVIRSVSITLSDSDFNAINDQVYPTVNIQYVDTDIDRNRFTNNFKIIIADLTNPNVLDIDFEIYSDTLQVAGDFMNFIEGQMDIDYTRTSNLQPFQDSNVDRTSGVVFTIGLTTYNNTSTNNTIYC